MKRLGITTFLLYVDTIQWVLSCSGGSHEDRDDNLDGNLICDGTNHYHMRICCKINGPCELGQGHCNSDNECADGLLCGRNNCKKDFSNEYTLWSNHHNCCYYPAYPSPILSCDGTGEWWEVLNCCRKNGTCNAGEGMCLRDRDCAEGLRCGLQNCKRDFSTTASNWEHWMNCCYDPEANGRPEETTAEAPPKSTIVTTSQSTTTSPTSPTSSNITEENESQASKGVSESTVPTPPLPSCGRKPGRIVGGEEVTPYSLPWQVAFVYRDLNDPFCGGTLISDRHVLTAAHCTSNWQKYDVIVGEHNITSLEDGTRHSVCRFVDHPSYDSNTFENDFSIVHLNKPVQLGARAVPACLPLSTFTGDFLDNKTLTVSGWGKLSEGGGSPKVLHSVEVLGMTNDKCNIPEFHNEQVLDVMLCAGQAIGGIDACQGDSGGPLTYTSGGQTFIVGVVSWGQGCARENKPGVYSRVTEVLNWINSELSQIC